MKLSDYFNAVDLESFKLLGIDSLKDLSAYMQRNPPDAFLQTDSIKLDHVLTSVMALRENKLSYSRVFYDLWYEDKLDTEAGSKWIKKQERKHAEQEGKKKRETDIALNQSVVNEELLIAERVYKAYLNSGIPYSIPKAFDACGIPYKTPQVAGRQFSQYKKLLSDHGKLNKLMEEVDVVDGMDNLTGLRAAKQTLQENLKAVRIRKAKCPDCGRVFNSEQPDYPARTGAAREYGRICTELEKLELKAKETAGLQTNRIPEDENEAKQVILDDVSRYLKQLDWKIGDFMKKLQEKIG